MTPASGSRWDPPQELLDELNFGLGVKLEEVDERLKEILAEIDRQDVVPHEQQAFAENLVHARHLLRAACGVLAQAHDGADVLGVPR